MKTDDLLTIWGAPDPPRLTPKQVSIRVPMVVSAKISALLDLYPKKTKTDIIGDLLTSALEKLEDEIPMNKDVNDHVFDPDQGIHYLGFTGMRKDYFNSVEKYLRKIEKEAGIKEPMQFTSSFTYPESDFKWDKKE
jgi:hypothetical protein